MLNIEEDADGRVHRTLQDPPLAGFLFQSSGAAWLWLIVRVWLGGEWLIEGWRALTAGPTDLWPTAAGVAQVLTGLALIAGVFVGLAATGGLLANLLALVIPGPPTADPLQMVAVVLLILAWKNAGYIGLDRWVLRVLGAPWWETQVPRVKRRLD
ncbi:MAG TPA: hypothetical protein VF937_00525 [Chloroflexota bacterium]